MSKDADQILHVSNQIGRILYGLGPIVQGGILAELTSLWLGGHHPEMRAEILALHVETIKKLISVNDAWRRFHDREKSEMN